MKENILKGIMTDILETKGKKSAFEVFLEGENINLRSMSGGGEKPPKKTTMTGDDGEKKPKKPKHMPQGTLFNMDDYR